MDAGNSHAGEDVASDLEYTHGKRALEYDLVRTAEFREPDEGAHEEQTVCRDKAELDEREGDRVAEGRHDGLSGVGGEGGGGVPEAAEEDEAHRLCGGRGKG